MCKSLNCLLISCLVLSCLQIYTQAATPIIKCVNDHPLPLLVQMDDCAELPCNFFKNKTTHMAIQFVATKKRISDIRAHVKITTLGLETPFELLEEHKDVCKNLMFGAYCPLYSGEDVTYHLMMSLNDNQPELPIKVEVTLRDFADDAVITCFVVDGRVKKHPMGPR